MPHQVHGALVHTMSGCELSRVRTELYSLLIPTWFTANDGRAEIHTIPGFELRHLRQHLRRCTNRNALRFVPLPLKKPCKQHRREIICIVSGWNAEDIN
jgi:hypothetical protein